MKVKNENRISRRDLENKDKEFLIDYILELEKEWDKIVDANILSGKRVREIEIIRHELRPLQPQIKEYNKKDSWIKKLICILENNAKPMSMREIEIQIFKFEPETRYKWNNPHNQIFQLLTKACAKNLVTRKKPKGGLYLYEMPKTND